MMTSEGGRLTKRSDWLWEVPPSGGMRVPVHIYASERLMESIPRDACIQQAINVAHLPGIVKYSLAMPDVHQGYGFPIGGVAATDPEEGGVISPGGIGYDINCGVRLVRTELREKELGSLIKPLINQLFRDVPTGVGASKAVARLGRSALRDVSMRGSRWAIGQGYGVEEDVQRTESGGCLEEWNRPSAARATGRAAS